MQPEYVVRITSFVIAAMVVACAGPASTGVSTERAGLPAAPKKVVAAILGDPVVLDNRAEIGGAQVPGTADIANLMTQGLTGPSPDALLRRAVLAEAVPTFENGLWKVLPDGRMETSWTIRESARWHDGTPLTTADLLFTVDVIRDRDLVSLRSQLNELISSIEAKDARTVLVHWKSPFIEANFLFDGPSKPLPRHILERAFIEDKATFMQQRYWGDEMVGNGPFKLREWARGSHVLVDANPDYALGRPKLDQFEVRFITDPRAFVANFLAGTVELSLSRGISIDEAKELATQWRTGQVNFGAGGSAYQVYPQFIDPNPAVILDVRFRRAMLHAIDRDGLGETFMAGAKPMHSYLIPGQPGYEEVERTIPRYEYDPRRATQIFQEIGFQQGGDGFWRDASNQPVSVELRNFGPGGQTTFAIGDYWQRAGIPTEVTIIPEQRSRDNEYRMTFPGFQLLNNPADIGGMRNLHSRNVALPSNNYGINNNKARYSNPQFDERIDRYFVTIPIAERTQLVADLVRLMADQLPVLGMFFSLQPQMVSNRLLNVSPRTTDISESWNPEQWDVKS